MYLEAFTSHFNSIADSRQSAKVTYPLHDVLFVTLCGVIAGAEGWSEIHDYALGHHNWFKEKGILTEGVPVDDTIARIISRIEPEQFRLCFANWMRAIHEMSDGHLIAIDGKTLCASYNREDRRSTIHMVNAFACANKVVLGQVKTANKSNEITAIPALLQLLDIEGALVSIDAMGCQTEIATQIVEQGGDYLLAVKANQSSLHEAVVSAFSEARSNPLDGLIIEKNRGRIEARAYYVMPASQLQAKFSKWMKLNTLCMCLSYRHTKGKEAELSYRYYISSATLDEQQLADSVRGHWGIENCLHWVLDVSMKEDSCQIYQHHGAENWAMLRQISLNMLRAEPSKGSIPAKQKRAWMKPEYLESVLLAGLQLDEF
ncbi:MAG: ISAs1 family transposase [Gammaproteobacteria bacterium]|nr:ISAs1 family transposase [Gammaproteobacteria bacterium]MBU1479193.1 ISAs1 family transposase [Gammaproteobacteria bacterium]MBU2300727.1 ISAs1 family transposase [Gammaproteobacteria bacterium]